MILRGNLKLISKLPEPQFGHNQASVVGGSVRVSVVLLVSIGGRTLTISEPLMIADTGQEGDHRGIPRRLWGGAVINSIIQLAQFCYNYFPQICLTIYRSVPRRRC